MAIAVVKDQVPGDYLDTMASLRRLTNDVDESIEPVLLLTAIRADFWIPSGEPESPSAP